MFDNRYFGDRYHPPGADLPVAMTQDLVGRTDVELLRQIGVGFVHEVGEPTLKPVDPGRTAAEILDRRSAAGEVLRLEAPLAAGFFRAADASHRTTRP